MQEREALGVTHETVQIPEPADMVDGMPSYLFQIYQPDQFGVGIRRPGGRVVRPDKDMLRVQTAMGEALIVQSAYNPGNVLQYPSNRDFRLGRSNIVVPVEQAGVTLQRQRDQDGLVLVVDMAFAKIERGQGRDVMRSTQLDTAIFTPKGWHAADWMQQLPGVVILLAFDEHL